MSLPASCIAGARIRGHTWLAAALVGMVLALVLTAGRAASGTVELQVTASVLEEVERRFGASGRRRVEEWRALLDDGNGNDERAVLERVNRFFNRLPFVSDFDHWNREDYWATPIESLGSNGADCEDYAIAKYFTLRHLGVPDERLRMVYVRALELDEAHMVLAYYPAPGTEPLILDNLRQEIHPASRRADLLPVYSFNGTGLWLVGGQMRERNVGGAQRLGLWMDLQTRMRRQGVLR